MSETLLLITNILGLGGKSIQLEQLNQNFPIGLRVQQLGVHQEQITKNLNCLKLLQTFPNSYQIYDIVNPSYSIMKTLKVSFERRMSQFEENGSLIMATILDPLFKLSWCSGATYTENKCFTEF